MKLTYTAIAIVISPAALVLCAITSPLAGAQQTTALVPGAWQNILIPDGDNVYDVVNHVTWLGNANLADTETFGLKQCPPLGEAPTEPCVNPGGSMSYDSALKWVEKMNDNVPKGHPLWQLPTTPFTEPGPGCGAKGPPGNSFGFGCEANALGSLYTELGFEAPNTAIPIPANTVGPFKNFQPNHYWSDSPGGGLSCNIANFDFADGSQGGGCGQDFLDVLPMINRKILGTPAANGNGLEVNPGGKTIYDPIAGVTWLANANLAASSETFGIERCQTASTPKPCIAIDGSMDYYSAQQFILKMNEYDNKNGYLGHHDWTLPPVNASCPSYGCHDKGNPMGILYYTQFHLTAGTPVVAPPDNAVGPFSNLVIYPYWSCQAPTIQHACEPETIGPNGPGGQLAEWGFSFSDGFLGTARIAANHYVTAYFVGCDLSACQTISFPPIKTAEDALTTLALSATASSRLAVSFASSTPKVCTVSGHTASLKFPGKCTFEASQSGDDSFYSALPVQQSFTVEHARQTITFPVIPTQKQGVILHFNAKASSGLPVSYSTTTPKVCELLGPNATTLNVGTCIVDAYQSGNDLYAPAGVTRSFIVKAE